MQEDYNMIKTTLNQSINVILKKDDTYKKSFLIQFGNNLEFNNIIKILISLQREKDIIMCIDKLHDFVDIKVISEVCTSKNINYINILNTYSNLLSSKTLINLIMLLETNELKIEYLDKLKDLLDLKDVRDFFEEYEDLTYYKALIFGENLSNIELMATIYQIKDKLLKLNICKIHYKRIMNTYNVVFITGVEDEYKIEFLENNIFNCTEEFVDLLLKGIEDEEIKNNLLSKDKGINSLVESINFTSDEEIINFIRENKSYLFENKIYSLINKLSSEENIINELRKLLLETNLSSLVEFITLTEDKIFKSKLMEEFSSNLYSKDYEYIILNSENEVKEELLITYINKFNNYNFSRILLNLEDALLKSNLIKLYDEINNDWVENAILSLNDFKDTQKVYDDIKNTITLDYEQENMIYKYMLSVFQVDRSNYNLIYNKESIINLFSKMNNMDKENFNILLDFFKGDLFKVINSDNVQRVANLPKNQLIKYLNLFNKSTLRIDDSIINDVLNMSLSKKYANENVSDLNLFSEIKCLILNNQVENKDIVFNKVNCILEFLEKTNYKAYHKYKKEHLDLYQELYVQYDNDDLEITLNDIAQLVGFYLASSKELYIKNNIDSYRKKLETEDRVTLSSLIDSIDEDNFKTLQNIIIAFSLEAKIFENEIYLQKCINMHKEYRDPFYTDKSKIMPKGFNSTYRMFNKIMLELYDSRELDFIGAYKELEYNHQLKVVSSEEVVNYLIDIDVDKLSKNYLVEEKKEDYERLLNALQKNKILGWSSLFNEILDEFELSITRDDIASYIAYFNVINDNLNTTRLIDLIKEIKLYSSKSSVYSKVLGNKEYSVYVRNASPNASVTTTKERLEQIPSIVRNLFAQKKTTVPPINHTFEYKGKLIRAVVGDRMSMDNITQGEKTGSCLRVHGAGSTLYEFIIENENGFHVKFYNEKTGKQISRISGIRNGNSVFLNGLRHSLDLSFITDKELADFTKVFSEYMMDNQNIDTTLYTEIENIFISDNYAMSIADEKTPYKVDVAKIKEGYSDNLYFDMHKDNALVLASRNNNYEINTNKEKVYKYDILRLKPIKIVDSNKIVQKITQLHIINQLLSDISIENIETPLINVVPCYAICNDDYLIGYDSNDNEMLRMPLVNTDINIMLNEVNSYLSDNKLKGIR